LLEGAGERPAGAGARRAAAMMVRGVRRAALAFALVSAPFMPRRARAGDASPPPAPDYTTVVRAPGGPPQPISTAVDAVEARRLPGAGGDPALAAQNLPGVARPPPGAT